MDPKSFILIGVLILLAGGILTAILEEMKPKPPTMCDNCQHLKRIVSDKYICPHLNDGYTYGSVTYCVNYCRRETHANEE